MAGWPATLLFPQIVGQNCGGVISGDIRFSQDPDHGELCLWRAYTACRTATLVFEQRNVDRGVNNAITVQRKAGGCGVSISARGYAAIFHSSASPITTYQCSAINPRGGGLLVSGCGRIDDLFLPPPGPEPAMQRCGVISDVNHIVSAIGRRGQETGAIAGIEDCFWQAYTSCVGAVTAGPDTILTAATLTYESESPPAGTDTQLTAQHTLTAQMFGGSCKLTDEVISSPQLVRLYTCASLTRSEGGGLVAQGCGKEGDIIISPAPPQSK